MLALVSATLFVSAFLLFCFQPMVGKMVLPLLGGTASIWATCVVFFQMMLLAGYFYAHSLGRLRTRHQISIHLILMIIASAFLPVRFDRAPGNFEQPAAWLILQLLISCAAPFAVVSATAPLLQNWLSKTKAAAAGDPYFLYATSNAGSLIALAAYPFLIEPQYAVDEQSLLWLVGYGGLIAVVALSALFLFKQIRESKSDVSESPPPPSLLLRTFWLSAAFVPSALMLAVTNHISLNIGSVPLLWIAPLALYLLTFILAFARNMRISTALVSSATTLAVLMLFPVTAVSIVVHSSHMWALILCHLAVLFFGSLLCHSALADSRPATKYLTEFYLIVAIGGVLGGLFTVMMAPALFATVFEYPLIVAAVMFFRKPRQPQTQFTLTDGVELTLFALFLAGVYVLINRLGANTTVLLSIDLVLLTTLFFLFRKRQPAFAIGFAILVISCALVLPQKFEGASRVSVTRNFFGVKKVLYEADVNMRKLLHGDTMHGRESLDAELAGEPLSYYHKAGPVGDAMDLIGSRAQQRVGVVGLGVGSIAAYGNDSRHITFFEIDPQVAEVANQLFTFMKRCGSACNIVIGDGRLTLQSESGGSFDLLIIDAFSSDSVPAHLVSREAVRMYMTKLKDDGLLMFHVSNRYLDVEKLVSAVLSAEGIRGFFRYDDDETPPGKSASHYVIASGQPQNLYSIRNSESWVRLDRPAGMRAWTDDFSNILSIVKPQVLNFSR